MLTRYTQRTLTWIDCVSLTPAEVRQLMHEFDIDPLMAEELLLPTFKPRVERRGSVIFAVLHFPLLHSSGGHVEQEIDFIIGKNFLITTRYENIDPLHTFAKAFEAPAVLGTDAAVHHGGHLFVSMVRNLYLALGNECDIVRRRLRDIEEHIFKGDEKRMVARLSHAGRTIHDFRQSLLAHEEMLRSLEPVAGKFFGAEFTYHVRELIGSYERIERQLDNLHDSLSELRETNNSLLETKQNEIMTTLTVLTFIFLPLTFIGGLFQMNTAHTPILGTPYDFWLILGGMVLIGVGCFGFFKYKGWL